MSGHDDRSSTSSRQYHPYSSLPPSEQPSRTPRPPGPTSLRTHPAPAYPPSFAPETQPGIPATSGPSSHSLTPYSSLGSQAASQSHPRHTSRTNLRVLRPKPVSSAPSQGFRGEYSDPTQQALRTYERQLRELQQSTWAWENRATVRREGRDEGQNDREGERERSVMLERGAIPQRDWRKDPDWDRYFDLDGDAGR